MRICFGKTPLLFCCRTIKNRQNWSEFAIGFDIKVIYYGTEHSDACELLQNKR